MHFHLPKPLHGWRELVGEVGIIVLGVLIALSFEALVDGINWSIRVSSARQELRYEVGLNLALLKDRIRQQRCADRRLDELGQVLNHASSAGRLPPLGAIGQPIHYTWPQAVWETQVAAQTTSHFPPHELASLTRIYRLFDHFRQFDDADRSAWLTLSTMTGPGRRIDASTVDRLVQALAQARYINGSFAKDGGIIDTILARGNPGRDFPQVDPANPPIIVANVALCGPIGAKAPSIYGGRMELP